MLAVSVAACGGDSGSSSSSAEPSAPAATPAGQKVDTATAGNITGTIMVEGALPKNEAIRMNADPVCLKAAPGPQTQETFVVGSDGKTLANVFVYVKDGLGNFVYDTPTSPASIDQKQCRYTPHVFGMRVGQPLEIINSDPTLHNIHATPKANSEFNTGQPIQNMKTTHTFDQPEVMVPFKCDVHGWMNAFVGVLPHPYFATTSDDGKFNLNTVPPGTYTVEAWHERLGPMTQSVTIGPSETKDITFTFKAPATASN
jgi:plastocyanin